MEKRELPPIGINEEVTYPFTQGLDPRDQGGDELTENKNRHGEDIIKTPSERPSTGKPSKYPYEKQREGVTKK